jgi:hypothetical protein
MWRTKIHRSVIVLIAVLLTAINTSFAQSYYHSPNDTIISNAVFNDISVFNIVQIHPTADTLYFKWYKQSVSLPTTWEASICDNGNCYTTLKDSGMMAPIVPGDDGLMSLHIAPGSEAGTGIIRYTIFATNTPLQIDTLTWIVTATGETGIDGTNKTTPFIYTENGGIICKNLNGNYVKAILYDANGRLLYQKNIKGEEVNIPVMDYGRQVLILQLRGRQNFVTKIINY